MIFFICFSLIEYYIKNGNLYILRSSCSFFLFKNLTIYNHNPFLKVIILIYLSEYVQESETVSHWVMYRVKVYTNAFGCKGLNMTITHQAPLSMRFSRQEYGMGCHFLLQGILLTQGSNPQLLHCRWILYRWAIGGTGVSREEILRRFNSFLNHPLIFLRYSNS